MTSILLKILFIKSLPSQSEKYKNIYASTINLLFLVGKKPQNAKGSKIKAEECIDEHIYKTLRTNNHFRSLIIGHNERNIIITRPCRNIEKFNK
jgi:hypothetical protein